MSALEAAAAAEHLAVRDKNTALRALRSELAAAARRGPAEFIAALKTAAGTNSELGPQLDQAATLLSQLNDGTLNLPAAPGTTWYYDILDSRVTSSDGRLRADVKPLAFVPTGTKPDHVTDQQWDTTRQAYLDNVGYLSSAGTSGATGGYFGGETSSGGDLANQIAERLATLPVAPTEADTIVLGGGQAGKGYYAVTPTGEDALTSSGARIPLPKDIAMVTAKLTSGHLANRYGDAIQIRVASKPGSTVDEEVQALTAETNRLASVAAAAQNIAAESGSQRLLHDLQRKVSVLEHLIGKNHLTPQGRELAANMSALRQTLREIQVGFSAERPIRTTLAINAATGDTRIVHTKIVTKNEDNKTEIGEEAELVELPDWLNNLAHPYPEQLKTEELAQAGAKAQQIDDLYADESKPDPRWMEPGSDPKLAITPEWVAGDPTNNGQVLAHKLTTFQLAQRADNIAARAASFEKLPESSLLRATSSGVVDPQQVVIIGAPGDGAEYLNAFIHAYRARIEKVRGGTPGSNLPIRLAAAPDSSEPLGLNTFHSRVPQELGADEMGLTELPAKRDTTVPQSFHSPPPVTEIMRRNEGGGGLTGSTPAQPEVSSAAAIFREPTDLTDYAAGQTGPASSWAVTTGAYLEYPGALTGEPIPPKPGEDADSEAAQLWRQQKAQAQQVTALHADLRAALASMNDVDGEAIAFVGSSGHDARFAAFVQRTDEGPVPAPPVIIFMRNPHAPPIRPDRADPGSLEQLRPGERAHVVANRYRESGGEAPAFELHSGGSLTQADQPAIWRALSAQLPADDKRITIVADHAGSKDVAMALATGAMGDVELVALATPYANHDNSDPEALQAAGYPPARMPATGVEFPGSVALIPTAAKTGTFNVAQLEAAIADYPGRKASAEETVRQRTLVDRLDILKRLDQANRAKAREAANATTDGYLQARFRALANTKGLLVGLDVEQQMFAIAGKNFGAAKPAVELQPNERRPNSANYVVLGGLSRTDVTDAFRQQTQNIVNGLPTETGTTNRFGVA